MPNDPFEIPAAHFLVDVVNLRPLGHALPTNASLRLLSTRPDPSNPTPSYAGVSTGARGALIAIRDNHDYLRKPLELTFYLEAGRYNFLGVPIEMVVAQLSPCPPSFPGWFPSMVIDTCGPTGDFPSLRRLRLQHSPAPAWGPASEAWFNLSLLVQDVTTAAVGTIALTVVSNWGDAPPPVPPSVATIRVEAGPRVTEG
ncbi:MAG: hypothetical protein HZC55_02685 [Verrucomicrobia bacterium]|nr:hypothetical protein [Verrucomicrobiota bacterium]